MIITRRGAVHTTAFVLLGASAVAVPACSGGFESDTSGDGDTGPGGSAPQELSWPISEPLNLGGATGEEKRRTWERLADSLYGRRRPIRSLVPSEVECVSGEYACECTENFTCDKGLDCTCADSECLKTVCGDVNRWGLWDEAYEWPEGQAMTWGSGSDDEIDPPTDGGTWE